MRSKLITAIVAVLLATTGMAAGTSTTATAAPPARQGIVSSLTLPDGSGGWQLGADGGVFTWGKVPYWGSYPGLPAKARQGQRTFVAITTTNDGLLGYALVSNHGERYVFRPATQPKPDTTTQPGAPAKTTAPAKPADPPTSVTVTASANPAAPGDTVTYTITVASTAIPQTTGVLEVTDNGVFLPGCNPILDAAYPGDGTFVGTCTTTYAVPGSHVISGIFTGDAIFAQSAGSMVELVKTPTATGGGGGGGSSSPSPTTTVPPAPPVIALGVTVPSAVQASPNYLHVTYTSTASTTSDGSPAATADGTVTFVADGIPACTQAVSSSATSASCAVTWGAYGSHTVGVTYTDTAQHTASTGTQTVNVQPPPLAVNAAWGVTAPTASPATSAYVVGSSAAVSVTDANWEGVTAADLTDQLGDTCTLAVVSSVGSCTMAVTGTPSSFTLAYPGGTPVVTTQPVNPNGVQTITTAWPARTVTLASPTVTVQAASPQWTSATISGILNWNPSSGHGTGTTPSPISTSNGSQLRLSIGTTGNASAVPYPHGTLEFTVSGGTYNAFNFGAFGSSDCSAIANFSGEANGGCAITFTSAGTYTINAWYRSADLSIYADRQLSPITVTVV